MGRVIGIALIMSGCVGLGIGNKEKLKKRIEAINELLQILCLFDSEITYSCRPLSEICAVIALQLPPPFSKALQAISNTIDKREEKNFAEEMRREMFLAAKDTALTTDDISLFCSFAAATGYTDKEMQKADIAKCKQALADRERSLSKELEQKGKLSVTLGIMGGLFIILILL